MLLCAAIPFLALPLGLRAGERVDEMVIIPLCSRAVSPPPPPPPAFLFHPLSLSLSLPLPRRRCHRRRRLGNGENVAATVACDMETSGDEREAEREGDTNRLH